MSSHRAAPTGWARGGAGWARELGHFRTSGASTREKTSAVQLPLGTPACSLLGPLLHPASCDGGTPGRGLNAEAQETALSWPRLAGQACSPAAPGPPVRASPGRGRWPRGSLGTWLSWILPGCQHPPCVEGGLFHPQGHAGTGSGVLKGAAGRAGGAKVTETWAVGRTCVSEPCMWAVGRRLAWASTLMEPGRHCEWLSLMSPKHFL